MDRILDTIDRQLAEPDPLGGLTGEQVAQVALDGLIASVDQGYMLEVNARAMYARHFPGFSFDAPVV